MVVTSSMVSTDFEEAASYLSNASSLASTPNSTKLEVHHLGLYYPDESNTLASYTDSINSLLHPLTHQGQGRVFLTSLVVPSGMLGNPQVRHGEGEKSMLKSVTKRLQKL